MNYNDPHTCWPIPARRPDHICLLCGRKVRNPYFPETILAREDRAK